MGAVTETLNMAFPCVKWLDAGRNDAALGIVGDEYVFVCAADDEYMAEDSAGVGSFGQTPERAVSALAVFSGIARRCYGQNNVGMAGFDAGDVVLPKPQSVEPD